MKGIKMKNDEWGGLPLDAYSATPVITTKVIDRTKEKCCNNCFKVKMLDQFYKNKESKDGRQRRCIECNPKVWAEYKERTKTTKKRQYFFKGK